MLSLVIPCYNEAKTLPLLLARLTEVFSAEPRVEVILVDNGSGDDTPEILASLAPGGTIRSVRVDVNQGYGFGILAGLRAAKGTWVGWTHADMQTDPADVLQVVPFIARNPDPRQYFKGRRYGRPIGDVAFTIGMSAFESALLACPMWDINAQPNVISRAFYEDVEVDAPHDFSLDLYFYYAACKRGMRVRRFPVLFGPRAHGVSHWNVNWAAKWKFIKNTVAFSLHIRQHMRQQKRDIK